MTAKLKAYQHDLQQANAIVSEILKNRQAINAFSENALKQPEVVAQLDALKGTRAPLISERGSYAEIQKRLASGKLMKEDVAIVMSQLKHNVTKLSRQQNRSLSQGRHR